MKLLFVINYINLINLVLLLILNYIFILLISEKNTTKKLILFSFNIIIFIGLSLYYNLDAIVLLILMSELIILILIGLVYLQFNNYNKIKYKILYFFVITIILEYFFFNYSTTIIKYTNFYDFFNINYNDFFVFYLFFFEKNILLTFFLIIIITLYSLFFILFYFNLQILKLNTNKLNKNYSLLRKQNLLLQAKTISKIRFLQYVSKNVVFYTKWYQWYFIS